MENKTLNSKKPYFHIAICILACICMRYGLRAGVSFALLLLGINELFDAAKHRRNQKSGLAITSLCLGLLFCGFVAIEVLEAVAERLY